MPLADVLSLKGPLSWFVWFLVLVVAMYFARVPAHRAIQTIMRGLYRGLRMTAISMNKAAENMSARNREVLLAAGRESAERVIEREFERIDAGVKRDLARVPCPQPAPERAGHQDGRGPSQEQGSAPHAARLGRRRREGRQHRLEGRSHGGPDPRGHSHLAQQGPEPGQGRLSQGDPGASPAPQGHDPLLAQSDSEPERDRQARSPACCSARRSSTATSTNTRTSSRRPTGRSGP